MVQAMGSQVMVGQQTPGPGGIKAASFSPAGQLGHVVIYKEEQKHKHSTSNASTYSCTRIVFHNPVKNGV